MSEGTAEVRVCIAASAQVRALCYAYEALRAEAAELERENAELRRRLAALEDSQP